MVDVGFSFRGASAVPHSASPLVALHIDVTANGSDRIDSMLLSAMVRIQASERPHSARERENLAELFGGPSSWARAAKSLLWAQVTTVVPGFTGTAGFDVLLPCSHDFTAAAAKYLHGLEGGDIPIVAQFSGSVFHRTGTGLEVARIPWDREASGKLSHALFHAVIDEHFPNATVLTLGRDVFQRLNRYRREQGLLRLDDAIERLLAERGAA